MALLQPLRELTLREGGGAHGWSIRIWQHDGCSIYINRPSRDAEHIIERLRVAVDAKANELGILTRLECKRAGS